MKQQGRSSCRLPIILFHFVLEKPQIQYWFSRRLSGVCIWLFFYFIGQCKINLFFTIRFHQIYAICFSFHRSNTSHFIEFYFTNCPILLIYISNISYIFIYTLLKAHLGKDIVILALWILKTMKRISFWWSHI